MWCFAGNFGTLLPKCWAEVPTGAIPSMIKLAHDNCGDCCFSNCRVLTLFVVKSKSDGCCGCIAFRTCRLSTLCRVESKSRGQKRGVDLILTFSYKLVLRDCSRRLFCEPVLIVYSPVLYRHFILRVCSENLLSVLKHIHFVMNFVRGIQ